MPKIIRILAVVFGAVCVFCVGRCIYMVACISCTIPHVQDYQYVGSMADLQNAFKKLTYNHQNIKYKIVDTMGDRNDQPSYEADLKLTDSTNDFLYQVRFDNAAQNKITVGVIGAFDIKHNTGGYGVTATGISDILKVLDTKILKQLSEEEHIKLQPL